MGTTVVLVTRDLRVHDNPALAGACASAEHVVPLFVVDPSLPADPRRRAFLAGSLVDMREALRERGGDLLVRHGDPVAQAMEVCGEVGATGLVVAEDVSNYAGRRQRRLAGACRVARVSFTLTPGVTVVPPAALHPYRVFTPYWRAWRAARWRAPVPAPARRSPFRRGYGGTTRPAFSTYPWRGCRGAERTRAGVGCASGPAGWAGTVPNGTRWPTTPPPG